MTSRCFLHVLTLLFLWQTSHAFVTPINTSPPQSITEFWTAAQPEATTGGGPQPSTIVPPVTATTEPISAPPAGQALTTSSHLETTGTTTTSTQSSTSPRPTGNTTFWNHSTTTTPTPPPPPTGTPGPDVLYPYQTSAYRHKSFTQSDFSHYRWTWYDYYYRRYRRYEYWWFRWYSSYNSIELSVNAFCKGYRRMYISTNGYVAFDDPAWASPWSFGRYYYSWYYYTRAIVAPFLAYTSVCGDSEIHYAHFDRDDETNEATTVLARAKEDIRQFDTRASKFRPTGVHIVTWLGMLEDYWSYYYYNPDVTCAARLWGSSYQLVLITDGTRTYAMFNYLKGQVRTRYLYNYVRFGYEFERRNFQVSYISGTSAMRYIDTIVGNSGEAGRWIFPLFETTPSGESVCKEAQSRCTAWKADTPKGNRIRKRLPPCPCNSGHAYIDDRYQVEPWSYNDREICFYAREHYYWDHPTRETTYKVRQRCCYRKTWFRRMCSARSGCVRWFNGPLIEDHSASYKPGHMTFLNIQPPDSVGFKYCCELSTKFCDKFYKRRPSRNCEGYVPVDTTITWGDPHIKTMDGLAYTFNGHGEYWMIKTPVNTEGFRLQARTARATDKDGALTEATVFTAFAGADNATSVFQVQLDEDQTALELIVDGEKQTAFMSDPDVTDRTYTNDVGVVKNGTSAVTVAFVSGWSFTVTLGVRSLSVQTAAPAQAVNQSTRGLLGVFNRDVTDDLTDPDGVIIPHNSTEETIFRDFGQKYMTIEATSLFTNPDGKTWADFVDASFVPNFNPCDTDELRNEAVAKCGENPQCITDYCTTRDEAVAEDTKTREDEFQEESAARDNKNPEISAPDTARVTKDQEFTMIVTASDPDNDNITLEMAGNYTGGATFDPSNGEFRWTPTEDKAVDISFTAVDSRGGAAPVFSLFVIYCSGCSGKGNCDFDQYDVDGKVSTFAVAKCNCTAGYEGADCQEQFDGCQDNPCEQYGTNCTDLTAEEEAESNSTRRYRCDCLPGFEEAMGTCVDIDECANETLNNCDQVCENHEGNYTCSCNQGYRMNNGLCQDIDECGERTDGCQQICNNYAGSYNCSCHGGYNLNPDSKTHTPPCEHFCTAGSVCMCGPGYTSTGHSCADIDECASNTHSCEADCTNNDGGYTCSCPAGSELSDDQRTCQECDEIHWGQDCNELCNCGVNVLACDKVSGCTTCRDGWTGNNCEENIDECETGAATCTDPKVCQDTLGSYACVCPDDSITDENGNCVRDPATDIVDPTAVPPDVDDTLTMLLEIDATYRPAYADLEDGVTQEYLARLQYLYTYVYGNEPEYKRAVTKALTEGSVVAEYDLHLTSLTLARKSEIAARLILQTDENDEITAQGQKFKILSMKAKLQNQTVDIMDSCSLMTALDGCNNGDCTESSGTVSCNCHAGYGGDVCTEVTGTVPWLIIGLCVGAGVLLIAAGIGFVCYRAKQVKKGKIEHNDPDDVPMAKRVDGGRPTNSKRM